MNERACREQLIELMRAQNGRIEAAHNRLDEIRQKISENRLEQLQQVLNDSDLAVTDIQQLEAQRHALLQAHGFDADALVACIAWCDDSQGQLAQLQQQLIENLQRLQRSIQLNNLVVGKGRDRVRRSLGILTGQGATGQCKTYSSSGKTEAEPGRRDIAIA